jgi:hypothetical protein
MKPMATAICFVLVRRWMPFPNGQECDDLVVKLAAGALSLRGLASLIAILCWLHLSPLCESASASSASSVGVISPQETFPREVVPGSTYLGGTRLRIPSTGWSFVVPEGWQSSRPEDSEMPFLMAQEGKGLGMIFPVADMTRDAVRDQLSQPLSLLHGLSFVPAGSMTETETSITRNYEEEDMIGRALATFGPDDQCVIYFLMGPREEAAGFDSVLDQLGASTRFADLPPGPEIGL